VIHKHVNPLTPHPPYKYFLNFWKYSQISSCRKSYIILIFSKAFPFVYFQERWKNFLISWRREYLTSNQKKLSQTLAIKNFFHFGSWSWPLGGVSFGIGCHFENPLQCDNITTWVHMGCYNKKTARVADPSHAECTSWFSLAKKPEITGRGLSGQRDQRVQSAGWGSDTRVVLFLSYTTKPHKISSFITKNKDFYDKILQNTCLGQNPMQLCEQCQVSSPPEFRPEFRET
jgi:hypothetical protein